MDTVYSPCIPFTGPILRGTFAPGKIIKIKGIVPATAYSFTISLNCGIESIPTNDIAMQILVRLLDGHITLNSFQNGMWDDEQRCVTLPIKRSKQFEMHLKCCHDTYEVIINNKHFCDFPQRLHYNRITALAVDGEVSIIQISLDSVGEDIVGLSHGTAAQIPETSPAFPNLSMQNATGDPAIINSTVTPPPSYDTAITYPPTAPNLIAPSTNLTSAPYPTAESSAMPMPSSSRYNAIGETQSPFRATQLPFRASRSPFRASRSPFRDTQSTLRATQSTFRDTQSSLRASDVSTPPSDAFVPLNAASYNFRPVEKKIVSVKCGFYCGGIVLLIALLTVLLIFRRKYQLPLNN